MHKLAIARRISRTIVAMAYPHYRSQFGDTTFTKVFVGGLAWETPTDEMRTYFEQFGDILEAVIITDKNTGKSKGYGFVCLSLCLSISFDPYHNHHHHHYYYMI